MSMPKDNAGLTEFQADIGIVTALPEEFAAVKVLLDNSRTYSTSTVRSRTYLVGEIPAANHSTHNIVLSLVDKGNNMAASHVSLLLEDFPEIKCIIMVGIAGGVPNPEKPEEHVRLGDVVVSNQTGIVQYDSVKEEPDRVVFRNPPRPPNARLLSIVRLLEAGEISGERPWLPHLAYGLDKMKIQRPDKETDVLLDSKDSSKIIDHPLDKERIPNQPKIFVGPIASGNTLLKNPLKRDQLREVFGVKAVEMEGSGTADATWDQDVGYLVVRGICDYCDSRKNDTWHRYAALVAAAYSRALLEQTPTLGGLSPRTPVNKIDFEALLSICREQIDNQMKYLKGNSSEKSKKYIPDIYVRRLEIETEFEEFLQQQEKKRVRNSGRSRYRKN